MSDLYVWDPFKYSKMGVSIVDAIRSLFKHPKVIISTLIKNM